MGPIENVAEASVNIRNELRKLLRRVLLTREGKRPFTSIGRAEGGANHQFAVRKSTLLVTFGSP
jgi:hypothetical protein